MKMNKKHIEMMESGGWTLRSEVIENTRDITAQVEQVEEERNYFLPEFLRFHWLPTFCKKVKGVTHEVEIPNEESIIVQLRRKGIEGPIEIVGVSASSEDSTASVHFLTRGAEE